MSNIPVWKEFPFNRPPEIDTPRSDKVPIVIIGAGPVGLALALDLAQRGQSVVILNALGFISAGSKAICFSKRSLDILDRLGVGERAVEKGVVWETGKIFWKDAEDPLYSFDLLPVKQQKNPAFINIQQYYIEEYLADALAEFENAEIRWSNTLESIQQLDDRVRLGITTPAGSYHLDAKYVVACDGSRSPTRKMLGLGFEGRVFEDNFLIADVRFKEERPAERWFRFDPPYPGWSSLIHKQPDGVWRLDFQLGWDIDREAAIKPENVDPFVQGFLGEGVEYEYEWISIYTFQCRRMQRFVHDRVIFAGDSAHLVSPFGARGCNGGFADAENLAWKLNLILNGRSPANLLETYNEEATRTADENILHSTRATDFLTPKSEASRLFRDSVLSLTRDCEFARPFVNSGRLSTAVPYPDGPLNVTAATEHGLSPGYPCIDAPLRTRDGSSWLLSELPRDFCLLVLDPDPAEMEKIRTDASIIDPDLQVLFVAQGGDANDDLCIDEQQCVFERLGGHAGNVFLFRPDQYLAGRWSDYQRDAVAAALSHCHGQVHGERHAANA